MMNYTTRRMAFTLAEVLITLAIVGIVAALTIPTLISKYQEKVAVTKLIKTYAEITQSVMRWQAENNCTDDVRICLSGSDNPYYGKIPDILKYLNQDVATERYPAWLYPDKDLDKVAETYYSFNGEMNSGNFQTFECVNKLYCSILKSGVTIQGVARETFSAGWIANFALLTIDINGKNPPNREGKDRFYMCIGSVGDIYDEPIKGQNIVPYTCDPGLIDPFQSRKSQCLYHGNNTKNCNPDDGLSPTAYVLKHKKLPDLKELGFPEQP